MAKDLYADNGIMLSKASLKVGDVVEIIYNGLLKTSGAQNVKVHVGYNEEWQNVETIDMVKRDEGFLAALTLKQSGTFNCAFVDGANNWDNNSGENYAFKVTASKALKTSKLTDATSETQSKTKDVKKTAKKTTASRDELKTEVKKSEKSQKAPKLLEKVLEEVKKSDKKTTQVELPEKKVKKKASELTPEPKDTPKKPKAEKKTKG